MYVVLGLGELGTLTWSFFVIFFQDKTKGLLLAGHLCPPFFPWSFPPQESVALELPTLALLHPELGPPQKCHLSEHAFPAANTRAGSRD